MANNYFKVKHGLIVEGPLTASFAFTTASWSEKAISSSFADKATTSSFALNFNPTATASYATTALTASHAIDSETATSASHAVNSDNAISASYALTADTATSASHAIDSDDAISASYSQVSDTTTTASYSEFALTASYSLNISPAETASYAESASVLIGFNFNNNNTPVNTTGSDVVIATASTGSYIAAFFDYAVTSGSNIRAGTVFGSWVDGVITYSEVSNVDVGDTSQVTMSMDIAGDQVELLTFISTTSPWTVRALGRYI
jgi:hypothetical protein